MKNFAEQLQGVNNKCMAIEDEACASVDGFSKPNADIMKEIEAEEKEESVVEEIKEEITEVVEEIKEAVEEVVEEVEVAEEA